MSLLYIFVTLFLFVAAIMTTGLALYAWQRRLSYWALPFTVLMLAVAQWSLGYGLELNASEVAVKLFWAKVQYLGMV
ncbi:MAG TPA: histidine kinase N-terminal 7TM domain-containing protein, partial [Candidatus Binatia bacterium]|nr:histidine kinase N-terminal 7TM domain-containing protein [Candidatus Binatia bacterium]